jgi:hypothetical protein
MQYQHVLPQAVFFALLNAMCQVFCHLLSCSKPALACLQVLQQGVPAGRLAPAQSSMQAPAASSSVKGLVAKAEMQQLPRECC